MGKIPSICNWFRRRSPEPAERTQLNWKRTAQRQSGARGRSFPSSRFHYLGFYALAAVIVFGVLVLGPWRPFEAIRSAGHEAEPERKLPKVIRFYSTPTASVSVVDGDTVGSGGSVYRLVGLDTPEAGMNAKCERERTLAARATQRLRQIVASGGVNLRRVPCACPQGTEGTSRCNSGRLCGTLAVRGSDVAGIMIGEGLARPYFCGSTSCPPRGSWCG